MRSKVTRQFVEVNTNCRFHIEMDAAGTLRMDELIAALIGIHMSQNQFSHKTHASASPSSKTNCSADPSDSSTKVRTVSFDELAECFCKTSFVLSIELTLTYAFPITFASVSPISAGDCTT